MQNTNRRKYGEDCEDLQYAETPKTKQNDKIISLASSGLGCIMNLTVSERIHK